MGTQFRMETKNSKESELKENVDFQMIRIELCNHSSDTIKDIDLLKRNHTNEHDKVCYSVNGSKDKYDLVLRQLDACKEPELNIRKVHIVAISDKVSRTSEQVFCPIEFIESDMFGKTTITQKTFSIDPYQNNRNVAVMHGLKVPLSVKSDIRLAYIKPNTRVLVTLILEKS